MDIPNKNFQVTWLYRRSTFLILHIAYVSTQQIDNSSNYRLDLSLRLPNVLPQIFTQLPILNVDLDQINDEMCINVNINQKINSQFKCLQHYFKLLWNSGIEPPKICQNNIQIKQFHVQFLRQGLSLKQHDSCRIFWNLNCYDDFTYLTECKLLALPECT